MQKTRKILQSPVFVAIATFVSLIQPFLFYLSRDMHYFADKITFSGMRYLIYVLSCAAAIYILFFAVLRAYKFNNLAENKFVFIGYIVALCISALFVIGNIAILVLLSTASFQFLFYFKKELPYLIGFIILAFIILAPLISSAKIRLAVTLVLIVSLLTATCVVGLNLTVFKLEKSATVFDTGTDYSVVWASNTPSVGWLEYEYEGEHYKLIDEEGGKMRSTSAIHSINVPYSHLINNTYTIYVQRVLSNVTYTPRLGKTQSESISFKGVPEGDLDIFVLSDTHNITKKTRSRIQYTDAELLLMLGDFSDMLHEESNVTDYLLTLCYEAVHGSVPVIFSKGNHELHCELGAKLNELLGFYSMYYQAEYGNYRFTVTDCGGDNFDSFIQFGGMTSFEPYREKELQWLSELPVDNEKIDILVGHISYFSKDYEVASQYYSQLNRLGVKCILSGHTHDNKVYKNGLDDGKHPQNSIPVINCGGIDDNIIVRNLSYVSLCLTDNQLQVTAKATNKKANLYTDTIVYSDN